MGLRIQNNVEAFNAHRQLTGTAAKAAKSMEKLSSGYRINRAADDAAGLAISEKMRAQIGGLAQAQRNAQDGVSLVQTAEGALNEVHSMLQRVRDLKVQYDNGTLAIDDKTAIVAEVKRSASEITDIGDKTEVQRHQAARRHRRLGTITFQVGANNGETISRRHQGHRRSRSRHAASVDGVADAASLATLDARRHRHGDQERLDARVRLRRGPEPPRAPPQQPRDLPGEPGRRPRAGSATWTWPARWSTSRSSRSCSRPARACSRRPTRPRRAFSRSCARGPHITPPRDGSPTGGLGPPVCVRFRNRLDDGGRESTWSRTPERPIRLPQKES